MSDLGSEVLLTSDLRSRVRSQIECLFEMSDLRSDGFVTSPIWKMDETKENRHSIHPRHSVSIVYQPNVDSVSSQVSFCKMALNKARYCKRGRTIEVAYNLLPPHETHCNTLQSRTATPHRNTQSTTRCHSRLSVL